MANKGSTSMQFYRFKDADPKDFPNLPGIEFIDKHITNNSSVGIDLLPRRAIGPNELARVLRYDG